MEAAVDRQPIELDFEGDGVGDAGCFALAAAIEAYSTARSADTLSVPLLRCVNLNENGLSAAAAARLAAAVEGNDTLTRLSLKYNRCGDGEEGAAALARIEATLRRNRAAKKVWSLILS